ncbi:Putative actin filament-binding protein afadin [Gryllus bimaculatus]|nr:Putative actin filament-binding protein afadin [Gryllus bimaculatus]
MLKHVHLSPLRSRADTLSLSSTASYSSLSPEPLSSRSSSYSSLSEAAPTELFDFLDALASRLTLSKESVALGGADRARGRAAVGGGRSQRRDASVRRPPRIFSPNPNNRIIGQCSRCLLLLLLPAAAAAAAAAPYDHQGVRALPAPRHRVQDAEHLVPDDLSRGMRTVLVLDEEARPAALQSCHPRGDSRFSLQMRRGGLVKIYDSVLMPGSLYKSLLVSERTTVDDLLQLLLNCYGSQERVEQFSLYEVCRSQEYQRKLHPDDCPLRVQQCWPSPGEFHFLVRRNVQDLGFRPRRKAPWTPELPPIPSSSRQLPTDGPSSLCDLSKHRSSTSCSEPTYDTYYFI